MTLDQSVNFSIREFRDALSSFATGVTIVTACDENNEPVGMTASSFNSVSTEPPLILWSVTKKALSAPVFRAAEHFAVHVLATDQTDLSNRFAKSGVDKFSNTQFTRDANNVPILKQTATRFDCARWAIYEGGDHWIIVGKVLAIDNAGKEGLIFGGGSYATAAPLSAIQQSEQERNVSGGLVEDLLFYHLSRAYHQMGHQFHQAVKDNGLTVSEWRILASLYGRTTHSLHELSDRTFLDTKSLADIITTMAENELCSLADDGNEQQVTGTTKGHERVVHLFALANEQEIETLSRVDTETAKKLKKSLKQLIAEN